MAKPNWIGSWKGGRKREVNGRTVWVIWRRIGGGIRRAITLDVDTEQAALIELALFERDPLHYQTRRAEIAAKAEAKGNAPRMDPDTLRDFIRNARFEKGLTEAYCKDILGAYLKDWAVFFCGRDLRTFRLRDIQNHLEGKTARHHRIVALKSFTSYLREKDLLKTAEDPTLELRVPQARPEKAARLKGYPTQLVEKFYSEIKSQVLRDTICLRAKVGFHDTEIAQIARGEASLRVIDDPSGIKGTVRFLHKKAGKIHTVSLDFQAFAAAQRLQARKTPITKNAQRIMLGRVAIKLHGCGGVKPAWSKDEHYPCKKCPTVKPGELRHSFATWAVEAGELIRPTGSGVPIADVASILGHYTPRTTKLFYEGSQVPPMIKLLIRLEHPEDPIPLQAGRDAQQA